MFVTNWISTTKIQKISEITNFFRHYFLSRTEVKIYKYVIIAKYSHKKKASTTQWATETFNYYNAKKLIICYLTGTKRRAAPPEACR